MEIIEQIKIYLTANHISQRTLAQELGISKQLLSGVLNRTLKSFPTEIKLMRWYNSHITP